MSDRGSHEPPFFGTRPAGPARPAISFIRSDEDNLDRPTVQSFGAEWTRFHSFTDVEIERVGGEYFGDLLYDQSLRGWRVLDLGCGSGRWTRYLARRAAFVDAADPSEAAHVAARNTASLSNVRVIQAGLSTLPYDHESFDLVASIGVLHHVPDTAGAIKELARFLRPGGWLYLYLYYRLEGRPWWYRTAFWGSHAVRRVVSRLPHRAKVVACEAAAVTLYLPFIAAASAVHRLAPQSRAFEAIPLYYYVGKPWKIIRNDALDRFGTPLEQRFTKAQIEGMLRAAGLSDIRFGDAMPRWRVMARKS